HSGRSGALLRPAFVLAGRSVHCAVASQSVDSNDLRAAGSRTTFSAGVSRHHRYSSRGSWISNLGPAIAPVIELCYCDVAVGSVADKALWPVVTFRVDRWSVVVGLHFLARSGDTTEAVHARCTACACSVFIGR